MDPEPRTSAVAYRAVLLAAGLLVLGLLFEQLITLLLAVLITVIVAVALAVGRRPAGAQVRHPAPDRRAGRAARRRWRLIAGVIALVIGRRSSTRPTSSWTTCRASSTTCASRSDDATGRQAGRDRRPGAGVRRELHRRAGAADRADHLDRPERGRGARRADPRSSSPPTTSPINPDPLLRRASAGSCRPRHRDQADVIMGRLRNSWIGWMQGVVVDMVVSGVLLYIGLTIIGLDFAIFFAVLTALFSVVPYFGAIASGLPPVLFALTDSPGQGAAGARSSTSLVQQFEGNVTIPLVMSRTVKLHPAVIAVGVVVVGQLFGFVGPDRGRADPLDDRDPRGGAVGEADGERARRAAEAAAPRARRRTSLELDHGDHHRGDHADHDHDLHIDPETGHRRHCDHRSVDIPGRRRGHPALRGRGQHLGRGPADRRADPDHRRGRSGFVAGWR